MVDTSYNPDSTDTGKTDAPVLGQNGVKAVFSWLDLPQPANPADQLPFLQTHLATLHVSDVPPLERLIALKSLFARAMDIVGVLIPTISVTSLPIPRKTRQVVRNLQDILRSLADDLQALLPVSDTGWINTPGPSHELSLWQIMRALSLHLRLSMLTAAPVVAGIWQQMHQVYEIAFLSKISRNTPKNASGSLQDLYYATVLMGCVQPASFTSDEINFIAAYLDLFSNQINVTTINDTNNAPATFWISPESDAPAFASSRKLPPPYTSIYYFSCFSFAKLIEEHLKLLDSGWDTQKIGLPDFAGTPAGIGVLRRLISYMGSPAKRRFSRRHKNYRATLCTKLDSLWHLFQQTENITVDTSLWMVTNESPDGLAVMHLSGETGNISVGDIAAIRLESGTDWRVCIVRWAVSENQENLELGLQLLGTRAIPASISLPGEEGKQQTRLSVLILPGVPISRPNEILVAPSGSLEKYSGDLVLVIEKENLEIREIKKPHLEEQNSRIEIFSIEPETSSEIPETPETASEAIGTDDGVPETS